MKFAEGVLVLSATLVIAAGKPQDVVFPEDSNASIPSSTPPRTSPATTTTQASSETTTTIRSTRIPPRDPTNRIVYLVSCPCQFTYQYMPVCGTDGQTYGNMGVLQCAKMCAQQRGEKEVEVYLLGACGSNNG